MTRLPREVLIGVSLVLCAIPFGFGLIRAVQTGEDFRYLWMAIASLAGATAAIRIGRVAAGVFAAAIAAATGMLLGATAISGIAIVSVAFGVCVSAGLAFWPRT